MVGARRIVVALAGVLAFASVAVPAQAQNLVFVKPDGNVWIANPDGSGQQSVTSDGTAANPYYSPSQSVNGTIAVARGVGANAQLHRLSTAGTQLNAPFTIPTPALVDPIISPEAGKVAMWTLTSGEPCNTEMYCFEVTTDDHYSLLTTPAWMTFEHPAWLGANRLMLFNATGQLGYADLGTSGYEIWFKWRDYFPTGFGQWIEGAASADGTRLALVAHFDESSRFAILLFSGATDLRAGNLTSYRATQGCTVNPPDGSNGADPQSATRPAFGSVSFSPASDAIAFGYKGAVYVASVGDCAARQVIAGASDPNWGAANVPVKPDGQQGGQQPRGRTPTLSVSTTKTKIAGLIRGMKVKVTLSLSGTVVVKLAKGRQILASTRVKLTARKAKTISLKPAAKVARTFKSVRKLKATLTVSVVGLARPVVVRQLTFGR